MKVLGFTGMPGSGKSEAMAVVKEKGIPVVRMGDMIWDEVEAQGLPRDAASVGQVADAMRKSDGDDVWALRTVEAVHRDHADAPLVVIDGVRSNDEVAVFRRELGSEFLLVAIHTDQGERFRRMTERARDDDPIEDEAHKARDDRELSWGLARAIALADEMIVNDGSLAELHDAVAELLEVVA